MHDKIHAIKQKITTKYNIKDYYNLLTIVHKGNLIYNSNTIKHSGIQDNDYIICIKNKLKLSKRNSNHSTSNILRQIIPNLSNISVSFEATDGLNTPSTANPSLYIGGLLPELATYTTLINQINNTLSGNTSNITITNNTDAIPDLIRLDQSIDDIASSTTTNQSATPPVAPLSLEPVSSVPVSSVPVSSVPVSSATPSVLSATPSVLIDPVLIDPVLSTNQCEINSFEYIHNKLVYMGYTDRLLNELAYNSTDGNLHQVINWLILLG